MKKNDEKSLSFPHRQKKEFEKFNYFFVDFLRYSFGRIKSISTVAERGYTPDITWQICFAYQLTGSYMIKSLTEWYFLTDYSYILENQFYFVNAFNYYFKPSLSRIFCVNSSVKVLSPQYEGPSTHLFRTSSPCTFIKFFSKYIFGLKVIRNYMSSKVTRSRNQVKLSINKTKVVRKF